MSYILEALKKLEQKRQRVGVPHPLAGPSETVPELKRRQPVWLYALFAVLLLNAGIMMWWVGPMLGQRAAPARPPVAQEPPSALQFVPQKGRDEPRAAAKNETPQKKDDSTPVLPSGAMQTRDVPPSASAASAAPVAPSRARQAPAEAGAVKSGKVVSLAELPPAVRSSLPNLKVSAHYFGPEPHSRFIRINDQGLREGQVDSSGLKLEEITPDGAVCSYQGYRFRIGIGENP